MVFKDGLQSTYNKAKSWNIPIVSILWIEACKKHLVLMNPSAYKIPNIEKYENPDLYEKTKVNDKTFANQSVNTFHILIQLFFSSASQIHSTGYIDEEFTSAYTKVQNFRRIEKNQRKPWQSVDSKNNGIVVIVTITVDTY